MYVLVVFVMCVRGRVRVFRETAITTV